MDDDCTSVIFYFTSRPVTVSVDEFKCYRSTLISTTGGIHFGFTVFKNRVFLSASRHLRVPTRHEVTKIDNIIHLADPRPTDHFWRFSSMINRISLDGTCDLSSFAYKLRSRQQTYWLRSFFIVRIHLSICIWTPMAKTLLNSKRRDSRECT